MAFLDSLQQAGKFGVGPMGMPDLAKVGGIQANMPQGMGITSGQFGSPGANAGANGAELALKMALIAAMA